MDPYVAMLLGLGAMAIASVVLPGLVRDRMITVPLVLVGTGVALFSLPWMSPPDVLGAAAGPAERLTELAVIIALTGVGLKIDRPMGWRAWSSTWRLLAVTMPLSIVAAALLGWWAVGLAPATALLLGAVIAPTDPVLSGDLQTGPPGEGDDEVRFALTSESSLNDGLAFPFTNAAIAMAVAGTAPGAWIGDWLLIDVVYKIAGGVALGWLVGWLLSRLILVRLDEAAVPVTGLLALAATLLSYGATEAIHAYGFIAVFVTAYVIRDAERDHHIHEILHIAADQYEHLAMAVVMVLLGGAVVGGVLAPLTWPMVAVSLLLLLVVRPVAGLIGLHRGRGSRGERTVIAIFGIRGLGTLYYLSHGLNQADFPQAEELWAVSALTVLLSVVLHGLAAGPTMHWFDERTRRHAAEAGPA